jgi:hypothetical protein
MPGFNGKQPLDLLGRPIYTGDMVQYGRRTAYVLVTLEDEALLMEFDAASTRPTDTFEQMWMYKPFDVVVRSGALSPIK